MNKTPLIKKIENTINPVAESMGFEIVRILMVGSGKPTMQIMAERPQDGQITIDECRKLSQAISAVLDVEEVMGDKAYFLEVSSPGVDRPLTRVKDFKHYTGKSAKIEIEPAIEGRKRFKGILNGIKGDNIILSIEQENEKNIDIEIPFSYVEKAKLTVSEDLLNRKQPKKLNQKSKKEAGK